MEEVIEESVLRVPHLIVMFSDAVHGISDPYEVFHEPKGDFLVNSIGLSQDERNLEHVLAIERHPGRAIRLVEVSARWKLSAAIKHADVV